jgi:uncharacterized membrane protein
VSALAPRSTLELPALSDAFDLERTLIHALKSTEQHPGPIRMVLISDHDPTAGDALRALSHANWHDVPIEMVHTPPLTPDLLVERIDAPAHVRAGDYANIRATLFATEEVTAQVEVALDGTRFAAVESMLKPGRTLLEFPIRLTNEGRARIQVAALIEGADAIPVNNTRAVTITVEQPARIALFADDIPRANRFADVLRVNDLAVEVRSARAIPPSPDLLFGYDGVVLFDTPAASIASAQQEVLERWVRDYGGGLLVTGGTASFGAGGYVETSLDRLLPLSSLLSRDQPRVTFLFVLDRSGSMQQTVGGITRLEVAKRAIQVASELLGEGSLVAIIAFDEEASLILPPTPAEERERIAASLAGLVPGGGTDIYPGLLLASEVLGDLSGDDDDLRHVIVLTDGLTKQADFEGVIGTLRELGATVSGIAIGVGADVDRVNLIAELGAGSAHITTDFRALPGILAQEALRFSDEPILEETLLVTAVRATDPLLAGLPEVLPPLRGMVETTAKVAATVHLMDEHGRAILASWRYGVGSVLAFPSDPVGEWGEAWYAHPEFPGWWSQWLRSLTRNAPRVGIDVTTTLRRDELWLRATLTTPQRTDAPLGGRTLEGTVVADAAGAEASRHFILREHEPGLFEGRVPLPPGVHVVTVSDSRDPLIPPATLTVEQTYASALGVARHIASDLQQLARQPNVTLHASIADIGQPSRAIVLRTTREPWGWLVIAACLWTLSILMRLNVHSPWRAGRARTTD